MRYVYFPLVVAFAFCFASTGFPQDPIAEPIKVAPTDWPWWRGPTRDGIAPLGQTPPTKWSDKENIRWRAPVPGRGHGSPIVVGDHVFLATAELERQTQSVLCLDRRTGKLLWETGVHTGNLETKKGHQKSSLASSTPACDGRRVFINFFNNGAIYTTALDLSGEILWQTRVTEFLVHQGYGASPALYENLVIVSGDHKNGGAVAALDRATGKIVWTQERPKTPNYASPIILHAAGRDQLVMIGCDVVEAFDPRTGQRLWQVAGSTEECVTSTVTDGQLVFSSGGYPKNHLAALRADGSGKIVWEKKTKVYVPSLLASGEHLYGVLDNGVAVCWEGSTGKELWRGELGGTFSASPILVGKNIYATNEAGRTFIFEASSKEFRLLADNKLGDEVIATPVICGNRIYMRLAANEPDGRQEWHVCIGAEEVSYPGCVKIFDGKTFNGWEADLSTWSIVDGAMRGVAGTSRLAYTKADYGNFRLIFTARMNPVNNDHLGVLFWGDRPSDASKPKIDNAGWIQFMPPHGAMWDYHPPKHHNLPHETLAKGSRDFTKWCTTELLCNLDKGTMRAAVDGVEIARYVHAFPSERKDPEKRILAGPIGMFRHGGGASEYKDIFVEVNPKEDRLITVK